MNKFTIKMVNEKNPSSLITHKEFINEMSFVENNLDSIVEKMENFLRSCGYDFEGELKIFYKFPQVNNKNASKDNCLRCIRCTQKCPEDENFKEEFSNLIEAFSLKR